MTPYRKEVIGDCELYLGDCLDLLPTLGKFDAVVDAVVTDDVNYVYEKSTGREYPQSDSISGEVAEQKAGLGAVVSDRTSISNRDSGTARSDACGGSEDIPPAGNPVSGARPEGSGERPVQERESEHSLSANGAEGSLQQMRRTEEFSGPPSGWCSHEQLAGQPGSSLRSLSFQPPQKRVVGRKTGFYLLTDPPYGINADKAAAKNNGKWGWKFYGDTNWDATRPEISLLKALLACTDEQIIWGGNYFTDALPPTMQWLVWDKGQRDFSLADCEFAWSSQQKAARVFNYARGKALLDGKEHPTQKPVALMEWCLGFLPNKSKTILDPFMGSGTTGVACVKLGRKFTGIERDPHYFEVACERIRQAYKQPDMFVAKPKPAKQEVMPL